MIMRNLKIKRIFVRRYSDNGETVAYAEWSDGGRTEARLRWYGLTRRFGDHMHALLKLAKRDGLRLERETW